MEPAPVAAPERLERNQWRAIIKRVLSFGDSGAAKILLEQIPLNDHEHTLEGSQYLTIELVHHCDANKDDEDCELARLLLESGAIANGNPNQEKPIQLAVKNYNINLTKLLLEFGADPNLTCAKNRQSSFVIAAKTNQLDMLEILFNHGTKIKRQADCLHWLRTLCQRDTLALLLEAGGDINGKDRDGYTPLHRACMAGKLDVVEQLVSAGADTKAVTKCNLRAKKGETCLHLSVAQGAPCFRLTERLLDFGLKATDCRRLGESSIHLAASEGHASVLELLIKRLVRDLEANSGNSSHRPGHVKRSLANAINQRTTDGKTALHYAASAIKYKPDSYIRYMHPELPQIFDLLLNNGADVRASDKDGNTPLHLYCDNSTSCKSQLIRKLVEFGADLDARNLKGQMPLHRIVTHRADDPEPLSAVIELTPDLNGHDENGDTALHVALRQRSTSNACLLIEAGADITVCNRSGESPVSLTEKLPLNEEVSLQQEEKYALVMQARAIELNVAGLLSRSHPAGTVPSYHGSAHKLGTKLLKVARSKGTNKQTACISELRKLKSVQLKPRLSLYNWLVRYRFNRPLYTRDLQLIKTLEATNWQLFPNYATIIRSYLKTEKHRYNVSRDAEALLAHLVGLARPCDNKRKRLPPLPFDIQGLILEHWSQSELCKFILAVNNIDRELKSYQVDMRER